MRTMNVGIIGTGFGGLVQLPAFLGMPDIRVAGIASAHPERAAAIGRKHDISHIFTSPLELITCPDIDIVSIATPQATHEMFVQACIQAGKSVLCEKPFTLNSLQAKKLLAAAGTREIVHGIDFEFRQLPALQFLQKQLTGNYAETVRMIDMEWTVGTWADTTRLWRWQCDARQGGGVLSALGVHLFDAAEWLLGPIVSLQSSIGTKISQRKDAGGVARQVTSEDHAMIHIKFDKGVTGNIHLSNVDEHGRGLQISVHTDRRILRLESASQNYGNGLYVTEIAGSKSSIVFEEKASTGIDARIPLFQKIASQFCIAVREKDVKFSPSFREGVRTQLLREATIASKGNWIDILY